MDTKTKGRRFTPITQVKDSVKTEFQTPPAVAQYMAAMIPSASAQVLEPTPGIGNIVRTCEDYGFEVTAPEDFFAMEKKRFDCIVMNPPFSSKYAFNIPADFEHTGMRLGYYMLTECMKMSDNVIALMPWFTISDSDVRLRALKEFGIRSITALPRKTFQYARIQTCVIHLQKGYQWETAFKVFNF